MSTTRSRSGAWDGWGLGGGVRYNGPTFADTTNTIVNADYVVFDAGLHYRQPKGVNLALNVKNIADRVTSLARRMAAANTPARARSRARSAIAGRRHGSRRKRSGCGLAFTPGRRSCACCSCSMLCVTGLPLIFHDEIDDLLEDEIAAPVMPAGTPRSRSIG